MFTGLVADLGTLVEVDAGQLQSTRLTIETRLAEELAEGDSIAVDGVCLTALAPAGGRFHADAVPETLERSSLGNLAEGARVNLELALRASDRLGGHIVQGHVDGVGRVARPAPELVVELPEGLLRYVVEKGSIALGGVSLTVAAVDEHGVSVAVIPETMRATTLGSLAPGDPVNVEVDIMAKHLEKLVEVRAS